MSMIWTPEHIPLAAAAAASVAGLGAITVRRLARRAGGRRVLRRWAEVHGLVLRRAWLRRLFRGPFARRASIRQAVWRVVVLDAGRPRAAYVRVGHDYLGHAVRQVAVRWDDADETIHMRV